METSDNQDMSPVSTGPWRLKTPTGYGYPYQILEANRPIVIATVNSVLLSGEANARLMVASPELFEALEMALIYLPFGEQKEIVNPEIGSSEHTVLICRRAIAKARAV